MAAIDDFKQFIADAQSGSQYAKWAHDNPGDLARWQTFRDAILAGQAPPPPTMKTAHGRELVDAAVATEHYRSLEQSTATPFIAALTGTPKSGQTLTLTVKAGS